jgi:hypothetical protein
LWTKYRPYQRVYGAWTYWNPPGREPKWLFYRLTLTRVAALGGEWEVELVDNKDDVYYYYFDSRKQAHKWIKLMGSI